jgi:hypothetical protein
MLWILSADGSIAALSDMYPSMSLLQFLILLPRAIASYRSAAVTLMQRSCSGSRLVATPLPLSSTAPMVLIGVVPQQRLCCHASNLPTSSCRGFVTSEDRAVVVVMPRHSLVSDSDSPRVRSSVASGLPRCVTTSLPHGVTTALTCGVIPALLRCITTALTSCVTIVLPCCVYAAPPRCITTARRCIATRNTLLSCCRCATIAELHRCRAAAYQSRGGGAAPQSLRRAAAKIRCSDTALSALQSCCCCSATTELSQRSAVAQ